MKSTKLEQNFTITMTNASKGFALLLLLWHHLFYLNPEYGIFTYEIAQYAKVSVAIFVILSGYGLSESIKNRPIGLFSFYKKRLAKLYLTYWFIILLFVPIGIFIMDKSLYDVFGDNPNIKFLVQIIGLHMFIDNVGYGYNVTWWFMSLIIALYILFPIIYFSIQKFGLWFITFTIILLFILRLNDINILQIWLLPFEIGIFLSKTNGFILMLSWLQKIGITRFILLIFLIIIAGLIRNYSYFLEETRIDWLFGMLIILFTIEMINLLPPLQQILSFIGIHSFNIFLFHSFVYFYYWKDMIYVTDNPIFIFLLLLFICLIISISLEYIKKIFLLNNLYNYIVKIKINEKIFI